MRLARFALACVAALACPAGFAAEPPTEIVSLEALQQQWIQGQIWCGVGDVVIHYQDITMHCDQVQVDQTTLKAHAEGEVIIDQGTTRMACDRADFDLDKKTGTLYEVDAFFPPNYHFRGKELEKLDATHYRFHKGIFTSCDLGKGAPPWSIEIRDATVEMEGYGHFRDAALEVRGVPVFYTPRLLWPVKRDRAAGLLVPNIGYNNAHGAYLGNALFLPLSRSVDTTVFLDTWSKGWVGVADELRWAPAQNAKGTFLADTIYDKDTKRWEWKTEGKYDQLFAGGYSIHSELHEFSNLDFFQSFERTFDPNALRTLYSFFTLSRSWGPQVVNLQVDHRATVTKDFFGNTATLVQERQPKLEYRLRSTRLGKSPFYLTILGEADRFSISRPSAQRGKYSRFDLFPSVSALMPGLPWLNITPTLGARETYYTARNTPDNTAFEDRPLSRHYGTAGLSIVGPSFSRIWSGEHAKFKHLFEPRLEYTFVSNPGKEFSDPLHPIVPLFDEKDTIQVTNSVKYTLANTLFVKQGNESSRELARLEVSQVYSFSDLLNPSTPLPVTGYGLPPSRRGALEVWLRASPIPSLTLDTRSDFDAVTHHLVSTSLTGGLIEGTNAVNLTWFTGYDRVSGAVLSSQTRLYAGFGPKSAHWRLESQIAYDIHLQKLVNEQFILRWRGSCWTAYAEYRDYRSSLYPTRDYRIAIDLTGLGTFLDIRGSLNTLAR